MKLKDYLEKERITPLQCAVETKIGITTIYRFLRGDIPSFRNAIKLEKFAKGNLTVEELRGKDGK